jgi:hypothetical protein
MRQVASEYPNSLIFWIDSASIREPVYTNLTFPNITRLDETFPPVKASNRMMFAMWRETKFNASERAQNLISCREVFVRQNLIMGTFFGGTRSAVDEFYTYFWETHNRWLWRGRFVGNDQCMMTAYLSAGKDAWLQPNFMANSAVCDPWFATWSLYGDPKLCFGEIPKLIDSKVYFG